MFEGKPMSIMNSLAEDEWKIRVNILKIKEIILRLLSVSQDEIKKVKNAPPSSPKCKFTRVTAQKHFESH